MKITNYLDRYLTDKIYSITVKENSVYIINYIEVVDFSDSKVVIRYSKGKTTILGDNLVVSKMMKDELLIIGKIRTIEV